MVRRDISIRERLRKSAQRLRVADQVILVLYCQERLLARLGSSQYRERFLLKGGLFLFARAQQTKGAIPRPTRDIDFVGRDVPNSPEALARIFATVCAIELDDGVIFDLATMKAEVINLHREFEGVRLRIAAKLGTTRSTVQVDVSFGDVVTPAPETMDFPTLLPDVSAPHILSYSNESVIAEKLHAIITIALLNDRMKDFYDIVVLARGFPFDGSMLTHAVHNTFIARNTPWLNDPEALRPAFGHDNRLRDVWRAYLARERLEDAPRNFDEAVAEVHVLAAPVYAACREGSDFHGTWDPVRFRWLTRAS